MILGQEAITRRRFDGGTRGADGRWVNGTATDSTIYASVQPMGGKERELLAEGERTREGIKLYTTSDLHTASQHAQGMADHVLVDGVAYEVRAVERQRAVFPHYKALALRLQETG